MTFSADIGPLSVSIDPASIAPRLTGGGNVENPFELRAGPLIDGELRVRSLRGREALSETFRFDIEFYCDLEPAALRPMVLGQPATLIFRRETGARRVVHGVTASLRGGEVRGTNDRLYRLRLVPRIWLLRHRRDSRIFQDMTIVDVVRAVLSEAGIRQRWDIKRRYDTLAYCVQYRETDYDFIARLLREAGCFFYFEAPASLDDVAGGLADAAVGGAAGGATASIAAGGRTSTGTGAKSSKLAPGVQETIVIADTVQGYATIESGDPSAADVIAGVVDAASGGAGASPVLLFRPGGDVVDDEDRRIHTFEVEQGVRSKSVTMTDYDFMHPLVDRAVVAPAGSRSAPARSEPEFTALLGRHAFEIYEHERDFDESKIHQSTAQTLLEAHRSRAVRGSGASRCARLAPGHRFTLDEHSEASFNGEFVVVSIEHEGNAAMQLDAGEVVGPDSRRAVYENRFGCAPSTVTVRPRRRRRVMDQVVEVAMVTGPAGEDVHTDEFGRIKVQFPWDREGQRNERSSCWIRVAQSWAGTTWGTQFVPRIGMEVLVTFLNGDTDRPVVTGCLYNAINPTPFVLPADKTRTGWRTQSSPGGGGFNELSFEDATGSEQVYLRAQRDLDELVRRNHTLTVKNDETNMIENDQTETVGGNRVALTKGDETVTVNKNLSTHVLGDRVELVDGALTTTNVGAESHQSKGDFGRTIGGDESRDVGGNATITIQNALTETVNGDVSTTISGTSDSLVEGEWSATFDDDSIERHAGHRTIVVGDSDTSRSTVLHVEGAARAYASDIIEAVSVKGLCLTCGSTAVNITPTGITISADSVAFQSKSFEVASDTIDATGATSAGVSGKTVTISGSTSTAVFDSGATVTAPKIALKAGASALASQVTPPPVTTTVTLFDQNGNALSNQRVILRTGGPTGLERTVVLDKTGAFQTTSVEPFEVRFADYPAAARG